jgi:uncharacterized protein YndB with AHSA1/START domain
VADARPGGRPIKVRVARGYAASAERVFDAWLDPAQAGRWLFATPDGVMERVEIDPRVGGRFAIVERRGEASAYHGGVYLEIQRPRRLVFDFAVDEALTDPSRISVDVTSLDDEGCELTLTHELAPEHAAFKDRTHQGWRNVLAGLARVLG